MDTRYVFILIFTFIINLVTGFTVTGEIRFNGPITTENFPPNTWLTVKIEDASMMDVSSITLGTIVVDISHSNFPITYTLDDAIGRSHQVRASDISVSHTV